MTRAIHQLSCQELVELVTDYLEGALDAEDEARFEEHLAVCAGCMAYLEQLRLTIELSGGSERVVLPPELERDLLVAFRDWHTR